MERRLSRYAQIIPMAGLLFFGCGEDRTAPVGESAEKIIGPAGGTLSLSGGQVILQVPLGALDTATAMTLSTEQGAALPSGAVGGMVVKITPTNLQVKKQLLLSLSYDPANLKGGDASWLRMVRLGEGGKVQATRLAALDSGLSQLSGMIPGGGKYLLASLKTSTGALVKTTKKKVTDVDMLFVVDNSGSMAQEQQNLAANFPKLIKRLDKEMESYRVGVISTDIGAGNLYVDNACHTDGDGGKLQTKARIPGCVGPKDPWIAVTPTGSNVPGGDVPGAFSCIARLGTDGCGFEQTLESGHQALLPKTNPGFLRKDAALALVYITDEDDCSASDPGLFDPSQQSLNDPLGPLTSFRCFDFGITCDVNDRSKAGPRKGCMPAKGSKYLHPVDRYLKQLKQLKPAGQVVVSAIVGPTTPVAVVHQGSYPALKPSCSSSAGFAVPSVRLSHMVKAFGKRGAILSVPNVLLQEIAIC